MKLRDVAAFLVGAGVATVAVGLALRWLPYWARTESGRRMDDYFELTGGGWA